MEFLEAARREDSDERVPLVSYFLVGHALELAFKAALLVRGASDRELRDIGHDLLLGAREASHVLPTNAVQISSTALAHLELLSPLYRAKSLEYVQPGFASLPQLGDLLTVADDLIVSIQTWVDDSIRDLLRARTSA